MPASPQGYWAKLAAAQAQQQVAAPVAPVAPPPPPPPAPTVTPYKSESLAGANRTYVNSLYSSLLGRPADEGGLKYWVDSMDAGTDTQDSVLGSFLNSPEYRSSFPSFGDKMGVGTGQPEPPPPPDIYSNVGADGTAGATGYKTRKSSWKTSGQSTKGTGNLKLQIQKGASGTGLNITG